MTGPDLMAALAAMSADVEQLQAIVDAVGSRRGTSWGIERVSHNPPHWRVVVTWRVAARGAVWEVRLWSWGGGFYVVETWDGQEQRCRARGAAEDVWGLFAGLGVIGVAAERPKLNGEGG